MSTQRNITSHGIGDNHNRFLRLARDYERLPETLAGLHFVIVAMLMLVHAVPVLQSS